MVADLETLLTALYVELADRIIPSAPNGEHYGRESADSPAGG